MDRLFEWVNQTGWQEGMNTLTAKGQEWVVQQLKYGVRALFGALVALIGAFAYTHRGTLFVILAASIMTAGTWLGWQVLRKAIGSAWATFVAGLAIVMSWVGWALRSLGFVVVVFAAWYYVFSFGQGLLE